MCKPLLPPAEMLLPYLKRIDNSRWYSNAGPLVLEFEERIGKLFNCYAAATSSGTTALTAALIAQDITHEIVMPSWTFVATANAVKAAGLDINFVDADDALWTPAQADIVVAPFGAPVDYEGEVMTDAAAAFDAYATGLGKVGAAPVVISTHVTKTFSTGEGGLVLSTDKELIQRVHEIINHGIDADRDVPRVGINGKMSEYHAAIGHAELDNWAWKRSKWLDLKRRYLKALGALAQTTPCTSLGWVGSSFCVRLKGQDGDRVRDYLMAQGIMSRKIWGDGVHKYAAFEGAAREDLSVTETLANEVIFLPYSIDMVDEEIQNMATAVQEAMQCA
jgi:dTDP-4-amino-4,6-dideoxygalactose transaminase